MNTHATLPLYWTRFWFPLGTRVQLDSSGYLRDPHSESSRLVRSFDDIKVAPCLVLLGEPGAGKSTTLHPLLSLAPSQGTDGAVEYHVWFDLSGYGNEDRLVRDLFERSEIVARWRGGNTHLTLTLDSFDECLIRIDTLASMLPDELERLPTDRLRLRIISRSSIWPRHLEERLRKLWSGIEVVELAPLRRSDIVAAAERAGVDQRKFLEAVAHRQAQPFAMNPSTLTLLLRTFKEHGALPKTRTDLYLQGCTVLCQEQSATRIAAQRVGDLTPAQRVSLAGRVAALTLLCGRASVALSGPAEMDGNSCVGLNDLCAGTESIAGQILPITQRVMREVLDTSLFRLAGSGQAAFAHRSYSEFLAAHYMLERGLSVEQILDLVTHHETKQRVIPQLHQVAAWAATLNDKLRRRLIDLDPRAVLYSDLTHASDEVKESLVARLLQAAESWRFVDDDVGARRAYAELGHASLAKQLGTYIRSRDVNIIARRMAIDLSEACGARNLSEDLFTVALDRTDVGSIRAQAIRTIVRLGLPGMSTRLRPILAEGPDTDPDDQLFGNVLTGLWPNSIGAEEVFKLIRPPRDERFLGSYALFLDHHLVDNLSARDLVWGMIWVASQDATYNLPFRSGDLVRALLAAAWAALDEEPLLRRPFARAVWSRLRLCENAFACDRSSSRIDLSVDGRRKLFLLLASEPVPEVDFASTIVGTDLIQSHDAAWLLAQIEAVADVQVRSFLLDALEYVAQSSDFVRESTLVDQLIATINRDADAKQRLCYLVAPVSIHSPLAVKAREDQRRRTEWEQESRQRSTQLSSSFSRSAALERWLPEARLGNLSAWPNVAVALIAQDGTGGYRHEDAEMSKAEGWQLLEVSVKDEILDAAEGYLRDASPPRGWIFTARLPYEAGAGYRALALLFDVDPLRFERFEAPLFGKWCETIIGWPGQDDEARSNRLRSLVEYIWKRNHECVLSVVRQILAPTHQSPSQVHLLAQLENIWDERLGEVVVGAIRDNRLDMESFATALAALMEKHLSVAFEYAMALSVRSRGMYSACAERIFVAARELLANEPRGCWSELWPSLVTNVPLARRVVEHHAQTRLSRPFTCALSADEAADVYLWLLAQYPPAEDAHIDGWIGPREAVAMMRDAILADIRKRGTSEAYDAMVKIHEMNPRVDRYAWDVLIAEDAMLANTWQPPTPAEMLKLAEDASRRLVQSGADLMDVVLRALDDIASDLRGDNARVRLLWDEQKKGDLKRESERRFMPKDEAALTDYIGDRLREVLVGRSIVVNREVQVRRGDRTDLLIEALTTDRRMAGVAKVIVEVKGCWNEELRTAMAVQLRDRYLREERARHGIYLVGWYRCDKWWTQDYKKGRSPEWSVSEATEWFEDEARKLSTGGVVVRPKVLDLSIT